MWWLTLGLALGRLKQNVWECGWLGYMVRWYLKTLHNKAPLTPSSKTCLCLWLCLWKSWNHVTFPCGLLQFPEPELLLHGLLGVHLRSDNGDLFILEDGMWTSTACRIMMYKYIDCEWRRHPKALWRVDLYKQAHQLWRGVERPNPAKPRTRLHASVTHTHACVSTFQLFHRLS